MPHRPRRTQVADRVRLRADVGRFRSDLRGFRRRIRTHVPGNEGVRALNQEHARLRDELVCLLERLGRLYPALRAATRHPADRPDLPTAGAVLSW